MANEQLAQRLIAQEPDLIGGTGAWLSSFTLAVTEVTERAQIPWLTLSFADNITDRGFKYVFQTSPLASLQSMGSVPALLDLADSRDLARPAEFVLQAPGIKGRQGEEEIVVVAPREHEVLAVLAAVHRGKPLRDGQCVEIEAGADTARRTELAEVSEQAVRHVHGGRCHAPQRLTERQPRLGSQEATHARIQRLEARLPRPEQFETCGRHAGRAGHEHKVAGPGTGTAQCQIGRHEAQYLDRDYQRTGDRVTADQCDAMLISQRVQAVRKLG
jgi:hypothetical protein